MLKVAASMNGTATEAAPAPEQVQTRLVREDGPFVYWAYREIDGKEWATKVELTKEATETDVRRAVDREFKRGHKWLTNGAQDVQPLPEKINLLVNVFTYAKQIGADAFSYCCGISHPDSLGKHERIENVRISYTHGYPTDKVRNAVVKEARQHGHDFVLMIDDDQCPDIGLSECQERTDIVPFLPSAIDFALAHDGPCLVGAPYCGSPPLQDVMVMKHREYIPGLRDGMGLKIDKYTRLEAAWQTGIKRVAALPTGMLLVDLRVADVLPPPWFSYEYEDPPFNTSLASTEDIVFTRNLDWCGVKQYCHWSAWAGHDKRFRTGIPTIAPVIDIPQSIFNKWSTAPEGRATGWRPKQQRT